MKSDQKCEEMSIVPGLLINAFPIEIRRVFASKEALLRISAAVECGFIWRIPGTNLCF